MDSKEGLLFTDGKSVFKCLTLFNEQIDMMNYSIEKNELLSPTLKLIHQSFIDTEQYILHNFFMLKSLSESIKINKIERIAPFDVFKVHNFIILKMPYIDFFDYNGGHENEMIQLMKDLKKIGWIATDIVPKNLKLIKSSNKLIVLDIGYFFIPYYEDLFKTMCRRAYICMKFANEPNFKTLIRAANTDDEFSFLDDSAEHLSQFQSFYDKVIS